MVQQADNDYLIPKPLVHKLIIAILGALITLTGTTILWAYKYGAVTAELQTKVDRLEKENERFKREHEAGLHPTANARLNAVERWQAQHDREHR